MRTNRDLGWEHYPANDETPEHYSCPFGLVIKDESSLLWECWLFNSAVRRIHSADELELYKALGARTMENHAKRLVLANVNKYMSLQNAAMGATA